MWDGTWIEFRRTSWDLHRVRCDWELKCYSSIPHLGERRTWWRWITKIGTWLEVRCEYIVLNGGETLHGWRWDNTHGTWMQVRQDKWDLNVAKILLSRFVWNWDVTWMEVRRIYRDLHWDELRPGWMWDVNITPGLYNLDLPPSRWQVTFIKVPKLHLSSTQYPYQCHPGLISLQVLSHLHLGSRLNSIHVSSDFHHGP